uniref:BLTX327 n=1 Tax=Nephila pilipes TaxID=299642 RepID=A0A076L290_NEPPI|nr:BLTX327 [Nephila pilipes]
MKTEVFMGGTPGMRETTNIHSLPKTTEDPVLLLLDTPQNTPVGTPGSDIIISSDDTVEILEAAENPVQESTSEVLRSAPQPIEAPKSQQQRRRRKKETHKIIL